MSKKLSDFSDSFFAFCGAALDQSDEEAQNWLGKEKQQRREHRTHQQHQKRCRRKALLCLLRLRLRIEYSVADGGGKAEPRSDRADKRRHGVAERDGGKADIAEALADKKSIVYQAIKIRRSG